MCEPLVMVQCKTSMFSHVQTSLEQLSMNNLETWPIFFKKSIPAGKTMFNTAFLNKLTPTVFSMENHISVF